MGRGRGGAADAAPEDPPVDPDWLAGQLAELERLADEGETLEVVGKLRTIVEKPQRIERPDLSDTGSYVLDLKPQIEHGVDTNP